MLVFATLLFVFYMAAGALTPLNVSGAGLRGSVRQEVYTRVREQPSGHICTLLTNRVTEGFHCKLLQTPYPHSSKEQKTQSQVSLQCVASCYPDLRRCRLLVTN